MQNSTQLEKYKALRNYININFKEDINIQKVEQISLYSYRNINRIFRALHHETIGQYLKRIRLEKAAEYLKYSDSSILDIALEVGFSDVAAFSKAFKSKFKIPPATFRKSVNHSYKPIDIADVDNIEQLSDKIEYLPNFEILAVEYRGSYENFNAIDETWEKFFGYCESKNLLTDNSVFFAEILDDNEICDEVFCRYNAALILEKPLRFVPQGLFYTKEHRYQKYAKFIHKGSSKQSIETYNKIYANWMTQVKLEFMDLPILEFFVNHHLNPSPENLLTEIYIPVR
ncbi:MAG: GyrI-like domain-containing protein [Saprospiraceae bacterium]